MSSFYGGRQGAGFVIVQRFDGIDIPQPGDGSGATEYTYTATYYAVDSVNKFILTDDGTAEGAVAVSDGSTRKYLIQQTSKNRTNYAWRKQVNNGNVINDTEFIFPYQLAKGMVQCFSQGTKSASTVNYGEYVIIDTILNMHSLNDPDNGKVFRRGLDLTTELAGAEYIGQIQGPKGETPEVDFDSWQSIIDTYSKSYKEGEYTPDKEDIVPGSYIDSTGARKFEDNIKYTYATVYDDYGNVTGCIVGFKLPTLVEEFEAQSMSPYENRAIDPTTKKYYNYGLISEDSEQYIDNKWQHPFYQKWQIKIPHGYHGISSTNLEIIPTKTKPKSDLTEDGIAYPGTILYTDDALTNAYATVEESLDILRDADYSVDESIAYALVNYNGNNYYVKKTDCYKYIVRYRETNYDNKENGEITYYEIGEYDKIKKITMSEHGILTVFYDSQDPEQLEEAVRWIDTKNTKGITIDEDGSVHIYFNTLDEEGKNEHLDYPTVLDWIESVSLSQDGQFKVIFNNNTVTEDIDETTGHSQYKTTLKWIDSIKVNDDGIVDFFWNTDHTNPMYSTSGQNRIKYIKNVAFDGKTDGGLEGSGSQKFIITYNTKNADGSYETEDTSSWAPVNYIIETKVCTPTAAYPEVPYSHLLVIFSDPEYRKKFKDKWITYPSDKLGVVYTEWVDMGNVRGEKGGLHTVTSVSSVDKLHDDSASKVPIPPEYLAYAETVRAAGKTYTWVEGEGKDTDQAGWGCTVTTSTSEIVYFYDYVDKKWYEVGSLDASLIRPETIIIKSYPKTGEMKPVDTDDTIHENGFWFALSEGISAK